MKNKMDLRTETEIEVPPKAPEQHGGLEDRHRNYAFRQGRKQTEKSHRATGTRGRRTREPAFFWSESQREKEHGVKKTHAEVMVENSPNLAKTITFRFNAKQDKPKKRVPRHTTVTSLPRATDLVCGLSGTVSGAAEAFSEGSGTISLRAESSSSYASECLPFSNKGKPGLAIRVGDMEPRTSGFRKDTGKGQVSRGTSQTPPFLLSF